MAGTRRRHRALVEHFGRSPPGSARNAAARAMSASASWPPQTSPVVAQKILSCVVRAADVQVRLTWPLFCAGSASRASRIGGNTALDIRLLAEHGRTRCGWIAQLVASGALAQEGHPRPAARLGPRAALVHGSPGTALQFGGAISATRMTTMNSGQLFEAHEPGVAIPRRSASRGGIHDPRRPHTARDRGGASVVR